MNGTIFETFELPSKGKLYDKEVNPKISLRSMTTMEEMRRLSPTDTPYKVMSDIIEDCMEQKPSIHVYDMSIADYQFLLHKLRVVTYGPKYKMVVRCNKCNHQNDAIGDLTQMKVNEWTPEITRDMLITLPRSNKQVELKFQTPRDLDLIEYQAKEMQKKTHQNIDYRLLFTLMSLIKKVDGVELNSMDSEFFVKSLQNLDANYLLMKSEELVKKVGLDGSISVVCTECGNRMDIPFRITSEFFGPTLLDE